MKSNNIKRALLAVAMCGVTVSSHAALIAAGEITDTGTGFGNVKTVLTLDNNNKTGLATGKIDRFAGADRTTGDTAPGAKKNLTYSFGELGITLASQLAFVFNPVEPGKDGKDGINLTSLIFSIYSNDGGPALYFTQLASAISYDETDSGSGKSGFKFVLDGASVTAATPFINANNRIGLAASISGATSGADSF